MSSLSQFTMYSSNDSGGSSPGQLVGSAGTLITILNACLCTGYTYSGGTRAAPSPPWTMTNNTSNIASFKQGAGAGCSFIINDSGVSPQATTQEAWAAGYETVSGVASPIGSGGYQFPTTSQGYSSYGVVIIRKSNATSGGRNWFLFADSSTFYLFIATQDTAGMYYAFGFGDFYSYVNSDLYRCMIIGRSSLGTTASYEGMDLTSYVNAAVVGSFIDRNYAGNAAGSVLAGKHGDLAKAGSQVMLGIVTAPNQADSNYYLSPVWITESATSCVRGQLRGFYELLHPIATAALTDGTTISGGGSYSPKTFYVLNKSANSGMYCIEISATVQTN
jgi:hypothetical protein